MLLCNRQYSPASGPCTRLFRLLFSSLRCNVSCTTWCFPLVHCVRTWPQPFKSTTAISELHIPATGASGGGLTQSSTGEPSYLVSWRTALTSTNAAPPTLPYPMAQLSPFLSLVRCFSCGHILHLSRQVHRHQHHVLRDRIRRTASRHTSKHFVVRRR